MTKIVKLPQEIINKIAAGEVIERPAYAVKELIENAIDANASVIEIHIEDSGLKKISIIDNGDGMEREDLELSFLPHTTSKLTSDEFNNIKTLGFRGEALASIAAISTVTIKSRTKDSVSGTEIILQNGKIEKISPVGMPVGTVVTINNLFSSVPARKKFLKSQQTEFRYITEIVSHFTIIYPAIHFLFTHNKKTVFDLPKKNTEDRFISILGNDFVKNAISFNYEDGYIKLSGFLGKPFIASTFNNKQFIFVNKRIVTDKLISLAVKESFSTLLPASNTPVFLLHISLPFEFVDVNVHPRKETVAFANPKLLFDTIKLSVSQTLTENNLNFNLAKYKNEIGRKNETQTISATLLKESVLQHYKNVSIFQLYNLYILTITKEGIILIDQHAAHERILFEKFNKEFLKEKNKKQMVRLPKPIQISFTVIEKQLLEEYIHEFKKIGFLLENFSGNTFLIRSIPTIFKGRNIEKIIKDILVNLLEFSEIKSIDSVTQRILAFLSCRAAVKRGDKLEEKQCKEILNQLAKTKNNATCPHGRPTQTYISIEELNKLFKR
jgi:DNA mismatch repair protein MutL